MDMHGDESEGHTAVAGGAVQEGARQVEETFSYGGTTISSGELIC